MKKFIEITAAIKSFGAMIFAGLIIVYTVFGGFFFELKEVSFSLVWQAMFIAFIASGLHFWAFSDTHIKKMKYAHRVALFSLPLLGILSGFAYFGKWFPTDNTLYWLIFIAVYLFFFGVITLVFHLYTVVTGKKYTELLDAYKKRHNV